MNCFKTPRHFPDATESSVSQDAPGVRLARSRKRNGGFTVVEAVVAMGVIAVAGAASMMALVQLNKKADAMRTLNNGRAIVQRGGAAGHVHLQHRGDQRVWRQRANRHADRVVPLAAGRPHLEDPAG